MAIYFIYSHLKSINAKKGQILKGKTKIGVMGNTGVSTATHLHFQVNNGGRGVVTDFYKSKANPINPSNYTKKYGEPSPNYKILGYMSTEPPYRPGNPHLGVDYTGAKWRASFKTLNVYNLKGAETKVVRTGHDKYHGNYVIVKFIKEYKEEDMQVKYFYYKGNKTVGGEGWKKDYENSSKADYRKRFKVTYDTKGDEKILETYITAFKNVKVGRYDMEAGDYALFFRHGDTNNISQTYLKEKNGNLREHYIYSRFGALIYKRIYKDGKLIERNEELDN